MLVKETSDFSFSIGDVILAKYSKDVYYAKIMAIDYANRKANLLFDDDSREDLSFDLIFNVNETTSDIICVVCKTDQSENNDDIVLCDKCNIGFHQNCHIPYISSEVLAPEIPWQCYYCEYKKLNPYIEKNPFDMGTNKLSTDRLIQRPENQLERSGTVESIEENKRKNMASKNQEVPQMEDEVKSKCENLLGETETQQQWLSPEYIDNKSLSTSSGIEKSIEDSIQNQNNAILLGKNGETQSPIHHLFRNDESTESSIKEEQKLNKKRNLEYLLSINFSSNKDNIEEKSSVNKKSLLIERLSERVVEPSNQLNHNQKTSAFQAVKATSNNNNNNIDLNDKIKEKIKVLGKRNYEYIYCEHQDNFTEDRSINKKLENVKDTHCQHSDYYGEVSSKDRIMERNLLNDAKSSQSNLSKSESQPISGLNKIDKNTSKPTPNGKRGFLDNPLSITSKSIEKNIIDQRFAQDLPRHNWLEERIRQRDFHAEKDIKRPGSNDSRGSKSDQKKSEIKIVHVESLSNKVHEAKNSERSLNLSLENKNSEKIQRTNFSYSQIEECLSPNKTIANPSIVKPTHKISLEQLSKNVFESNYASDSDKFAKYGEIFIEGDTVKTAKSKSPTDDSVFSYNKYENLDSPEIDILEVNGDKPDDISSINESTPKTSSKTVNGIKTSYQNETTTFSPPKIIRDSPSKQYSIPSNEDLQTVSYKALSSDRKQSPNLSSNIVSSTTPVTTYMNKTAENKPSVNARDYENDRERFIEKHRSKTSVVPTSTTGMSPPEDNRHIMRPKPKDISPTSISESTNESIKRKIEIQRQLESQKRWIDEHDTRPQIEASMTKSKDVMLHQTNPLNPIPNIGLPQDMGTSQTINSTKQLLIQKQQQELEKRLAVFTKEIEDLKRQKEVLQNAQNNLVQEEIMKQQQVMESRLRNLQEYRQAQTMQFMRANQVNHFLPNNPPSGYNMNSINGNGVFLGNRIPQNPLLAKPTPNYLSPHFNNVLSPQFPMNSSVATSQMSMNMGYNKNPHMMNNYPSSLNNIQNNFPNQNPTPFLNPSQLNTSENMKMSRNGRLTDVELEAIRSAEIQQAIVRKSTIARDFDGTRPMDVLRNDNSSTSHYRYDMKATSPTAYRRNFDQRDPLRRSPPKRYGSTYDNAYLSSANKYNRDNNGVIRPTIVSPRTNFDPINRARYSPRPEYKSNDQSYLASKDLSPKLKGSDNRSCKICNKEAQFLCSGCRSSWYCSQNCQLSDWKTHAKICKTLQQQSTQNGRVMEKIEK